MRLVFFFSPALTLFRSFPGPPPDFRRIIARRHAWRWIGLWRSLRELQDEATNFADAGDTIGRRSLHIQKKECSSCGFPAAKTRKCTCLFYHPVLDSPLQTGRRFIFVLTWFADGAPQCSQLEREGQAEKDCRHRPHAHPQGHPPALQERLPDRRAQERPQRQDHGQDCLRLSR